MPTVNESVSESIVIADQPAGDIVRVDFSNVTLLLNFDGANASTVFTDSSGYARTVTPYNTAAISTAQSKFGGSSALFDSHGYLLPSHTAGDECTSVAVLVL